MKIYANHLDRSVIETCAESARLRGQSIYIESLETIERTPRAKWTFACKLYCHSPGGGMYNTQRNAGRAATWVAWGWFIAEMFKRDPEAHIGWYKGAEHFRKQCQEEHDRYAKHLPNRLAERDVSFLELLEGVHVK